MVFKTTATNKLIPNIKITFQMNMESGWGAERRDLQTYPIMHK